jgi:hypothetical protein
MFNKIIKTFYYFIKHFNLNYFKELALAIASAMLPTK